MTAATDADTRLEGQSDWRVRQAAMPRGRGRWSRQEGLRPLRIELARTPQQVAAAWRLVYAMYRQAELIDDNPYEIHTVAHALRPGTAVIVSYDGDDLVSTLTIMHESREGIPLDKVYRSELDGLRAQGRRLMEVGLFADRFQPALRSLTAIIEMMRYVFYSSCYSLADIIIGVNPHHQSFYERFFGFEQIGPVSMHPIVRNRPVVLLRGDTQRQFNGESVPPSLLEFASRPLPRRTFDERAPLHRDAIADTPIAGYISRASWNVAVAG